MISKYLPCGASREAATNACRAFSAAVRSGSKWPSTLSISAAAIFHDLDLIGGAFEGQQQPVITLRVGGANRSGSTYRGQAAASVLLLHQRADAHDQIGQPEWLFYVGVDANRLAQLIGH